MKLLDTCEPLFQYICRLNRSARKGGNHSLRQVKEEIGQLLKDIRAQAKSDSEILLHMQQGNIYITLLGFIDFMVRNSNLSFAHDWPNLAYEHQQMAMDEKFFDLLDATLADRSENAVPRLAVFYTCMGLGFTGFYTGQPEYLRRKMLECASRLRRSINSDESLPICPEAYNPDKTILYRPVGKSVLGITVTLALLLIAVFAINVWGYFSASSGLSEDLKAISSATDLAAPASKR
ncbi:MAG TPA: DotU family type IV/VI secretion system protein [Tepidisphaeraceae bacterium]